MRFVVKHVVGKASHAASSGCVFSKEDVVIQPLKCTSHYGLHCYGGSIMRYSILQYTMIYYSVLSYTMTDNILL